ncbi:hypothetical protein F4808DRAFT_424084 [Astrocystis sublimbata]|nr:hypothetical protein F4808DRAFT_424084 [Astrocystis sublimbata]
MDTLHSDVQNGLDARVHSPPSSESGSTVKLLLRRRGQFYTALLEENVADSTSLETARDLTVESLVRIEGKIEPVEQASQESKPSWTPTIQVSKLTLLSKAKPGLAEQSGLHGAPGEKRPECTSAMLDQRLDNRLLDTRVAANAAIFKTFSAVSQKATGMLAGKGFHHVPTPAFITYEFPGEEDDHFAVPYFDKTVWLAPTGEVHLGMALAADLERVYDIHTVFRREPESDGRHLTEFTMLELVFAIKNDWTEILDLADCLVSSVIEELQSVTQYRTLTEAVEQLYPAAGKFRLGRREDGKLLRVKFSEAKAIIRDNLRLETDVEGDLTRAEEAALGRYLASDDSHLSPPTDVFIITHFPKHLRACNIHPAEDGSSDTYSFDVILRGQEVVTGCQLLHSYEKLRTAFVTRAHPIDPDCPGWTNYTRAHEIGMPPWGGFGLGINRLVQGFLGLEDIRETVLFPRDARRLTP